MIKPAIFILGFGIQAALTALEFSQAGYEVTIFEQAEEILSRTSDNSVHRLGHGIHYTGDLESAKKVLISTYTFSKHFINFAIDNENEQGQYFLVENSQISLEQFKQEIEELKSAYAKLEKANNNPNLFGPPEKFYEVLKKSEYQDYISKDIKVDFAIRTQEKILDWPKFKQYLIQKITKDNKIKIYTNHQVLGVKQTGFHEYDISVLDLKANQEKKFHSNFVVNSTWENIESINKAAGFRVQPVNNRLKVFAEVELPDSLKQHSSMFLYKGSFGMFVNLNNGKGLITFANVTNQPEMKEEELYKWLKEGTPTELHDKLGQAIIDGAAKYIPELGKSKLMRTRCGIVKTFGGNIDINDKNSPHHLRREEGVHEEAPGYVTNAAMKFFNSKKNAETVLEIFLKDEYFQQEEGLNIIGNSLITLYFKLEPRQFLNYQ